MMFRRSTGMEVPHRRLVGTNTEKWARGHAVNGFNLKGDLYLFGGK